MEDGKDDAETNTDDIKEQNNEMTVDAPIKKGNTKWAIKTGNMSGSKLHLLSISNENLGIIDTCSNVMSASQDQIANNISNSSSSIFQEGKMYKRKVDKEDLSPHKMDVSSSALTNFVNEACSETSVKKMKKKFVEVFIFCC